MIRRRPRRRLVVTILTIAVVTFFAIGGIILVVNALFQEKSPQTTSKTPERCEETAVSKSKAGLYAAGTLSVGALTAFGISNHVSSKKKARLTDLLQKIDGKIPNADFVNWQVSDADLENFYVRLHFRCDRTSDGTTYVLERAELRKRHGAKLVRYFSLGADEETPTKQYQDNPLWGKVKAKFQFDRCESWPNEKDVKRVDCFLYPKNIPKFVVPD